MFGELIGLNNGAGMFALLSFVICGVLYLTSCPSENKGIRTAILIISLLAVISGLYFYVNVQTVIQKIIAVSQIKMFGNPICGICDKYSFNLGIGCYLTIISGGFSVLFSFLSM